jgi:hypothetical protein
MLPRIEGERVDTRALMMRRASRSEVNTCADLVDRLERQGPSLADNRKCCAISNGEEDRFESSLSRDRYWASAWTMPHCSDRNRRQRSTTDQGLDPV